MTDDISDGASAFRQNDAGTEPYSARDIKAIEDADEIAVNEMATRIANSLRVAWGYSIEENIGIPGAIKVRGRGDERVFYVGVEVDA